MYCTKCGKEIINEAIFCPFCGTRQVPVNDQAETDDKMQDQKSDVLTESGKENGKIGNGADEQNTEAVKTSKTKSAAQNSGDKEKTMKKSISPQKQQKEQKQTAEKNGEDSGKNSLRMMIIAGLVLVALVIGLAIPKTKTLNSADYILVQTSGYDTIGRASLYMDTEKLFNEITAKKKNLTEDEQDVLRMNIRALVSYYTLSKSSGLSNGETITVESTLGKDVFKSYGFKFKNTKKEVKVEGLEEPKQIDLASLLSVEFSGVYPSVYVTTSVDYSFEGIYNTSLVDFSYGETIRAEEGDVYAGEISYDADALIELGYVVTNASYEFTITGLNDYRISFESMDDETLQSLVQETQSSLVGILRNNQSEISANSRGIDWSQSRIEPYRVEVCTLDEETTSGNTIYLIYQAAMAVRQADYEIVQKNAYIVAKTSNAELTPDGTLITNGWNYYFCADQAAVDSYLEEDTTYLGDAWKIDTVEADEGELELALVQDEIPSGIEPIEGLEVEIPANVSEAAAMVITYAGHIYARMDDELGWKSASNLCEDQGGHLATVTSDAEKQIIRQLLDDSPIDDYWLGATDQDNEGAWQWVTGEAFTYYNWDSGQPDNDDDNEHYMETGEYWYGEFNDENNTNENGCILEIDPDAASVWNSVAMLADQSVIYSDECSITDTVIDPYGSVHYRSICINASSEGRVDYALDGKWSQLSTTLSTVNDADSDLRLNLAIWGDDKLLYSCFDYQKTNKPLSICLDVSGVQTLSIQTSESNDRYGQEWCISEALLLPAEEPASDTESQILGDLSCVLSSGYEDYSSQSMQQDASGRILRDKYRLAFNDNGYVVWNLNGEYSQLSTALFVGYNSYDTDTAGSIRIEADGEVLYEKRDLTVFDGIQSISLDLTNRQFLEIYTEAAAVTTDAGMYLANTSLIKAKDETQSADEEVAEPVFPEVSDEAAKQAGAIMTCGDIRYYRYDSEMVYAQAEAFCRFAGGELAQVTDDDISEALGQLIDDGCRYNYWISASGGYTTMNYYGSQDHRDQTEKFGFIMQIKAETETEQSGTAVTSLEWTDVENAESTVKYWRDAVNYTYYKQGILINPMRSGWLTVPLNAEYAVFDTYIRCDGGVSDDVTLTLAVFGDGRLLYENKTLNDSGGVQRVQINVSGVTTLTIMTSSSENAYEDYLYLGDPLLYTDTEAEKGESYDRVWDLIVVDDQYAEYTRTLFTDTYGQLHEGRIKLEGNTSDMITYNLGGQYTNFTGNLAAGAGLGMDDTIAVKIYGDGELLTEVNDISVRGGLATFEADVTDVITLQIQAENESVSMDTDNTWVSLLDGQLQRAK